MEKAKELVYELTGKDVFEDSLFEYIYKAEKQTLLNSINHDELPEGLAYVLPYRVAAAYVSMKFKDFVDDMQSVSSIREGDTQIEFGGESVADRLNKAILEWKAKGEGELLRFRKLTW